MQPAGTLLHAACYAARLCLFTTLQQAYTTRHAPADSSSFSLLPCRPPAAGGICWLTGVNNEGACSAAACLSCAAASVAAVAVLLQMPLVAGNAWLACCMA